jgi:hypothetical protein
MRVGIPFSGLPSFARLDAARSTPPLCLGSARASYSLLRRGSCRYGGSGRPHWTQVVLMALEFAIPIVLLRGAEGESAGGFC